MIINGVRWRIRMVSPSHPMLLTPWKTHALGVCDKVTQTIYVDKTLKSAKIKEVLCHEIVHASMFSHAVNLSYDEEEMVAELMSTYGDDIIKQTNIIYNGIRMK
jgi:hypothetical protein